MLLSRNKKNITVFLSENFHFLVVKFSVCLNRRVFVMMYPSFNLTGQIRQIFRSLTMKITFAFLYIKSFLKRGST